jgi:hypothetical protein
MPVTCANSSKDDYSSLLSLMDEKHSFVKCPLDELRTDVTIKALYR